MLNQYIPPRVRRVIYSILATLYSLELIFDVIDGDLESKLLAALGVFGFVLAAGNVSGPTGPTPPLFGSTADPGLGGSHTREAGK